MKFADLMKHLWRLIKALTVHRKIDAEVDDLDDAGKPLQLQEPESALPEDHVEVVEPEEAELVVAEAAPLPPTPPTPAEVPDVVPLPTPVVLGPLSLDKQGWISGDKVVVVKSVRPGYKWRTASKKCGGLLWHWTATNHGTALAMVRNRAKLDENGGGGTVHFWIEHDGTIYQSCSLNMGHGHAGGKSSAKIREVKGRIVKDPKGSFSVNSYMAGCEIVNVGEVRLVIKQDDGSYRKYKVGDDIKKAVYMGWPFGVWKTREVKKKGEVISERYVDKGPLVDSKQVVEAKDADGLKRCYQAYTPQQLEACRRLIQLMRTELGITDEHLVWGHVTVDPTRKSDPGQHYLLGHLPELLKSA